MRRPIALSLLLVLLAAAAPAAAEAKRYKIDVPKVLAKRIDRAKPEAGTAILLPSRYTSERRRVFGNGGAIEGGGYSLGLAVIKGCGGAGACSVASFYALEGERPFFKKKVQLAEGTTGYFKRSSCGANCSDPEIQWLDGGFLYGMSAAGPQKGEKRRMIRMANSAIRNGPR